MDTCTQGHPWNHGRSGFLLQAASCVCWDTPLPSEYNGPLLVQRAIIQVWSVWHFGVGFLQSYCSSAHTKIRLLFLNALVIQIFWQFPWVTGWPWTTWKRRSTSHKCPRNASKHHDISMQGPAPPLHPCGWRQPSAFYKALITRA